MPRPWGLLSVRRRMLCLAARCCRGVTAPAAIGESLTRVIDYRGDAGTWVCPSCQVALTRGRPRGAPASRAYIRGAMLRTERIPYEVQAIDMVGYLAVDDTAAEGARPGVLLMHEGGGQDDNVRARAERLA